MRRHVIVLPQGPEEEVEEVPEEEEEQEDPEMAQALRDACFEAARIAANDSSERPTKTAFAIFKETSMKAAVRHAVSDLPHRCASCPSHDDVGGLFTDFEPFRTASRHASHTGRQDHGRPRS